jgi:hypothetical protein
MVRPLLAAACLAGMLAGPALAATHTTTVSLLSVLAKPIASAKRGKARVLVPATIETYSSPHLYGSGGATSKGYDIQLANAPGCHDANACYVAEFSAGPGMAIKGAVVTLAHGLTGRYAASVCGSSCNPATLEWSEFGINYAIGYIGTKRQLVALADSAIKAGPR